MPFGRLGSASDIEGAESIRVNFPGVSGPIRAHDGWFWDDKMKKKFFQAVEGL